MSCDETDAIFDASGDRRISKANQALEEARIVVDHGLAEAAGRAAYHAAYHARRR
jgi:uncharacterized protein (UPF0332 family)